MKINNIIAQVLLLISFGAMGICRVAPQTLARGFDSTNAAIYQAFHERRIQCPAFMDIDDATTTYACTVTIPKSWYYKGDGLRVSDMTITPDELRAIIGHFNVLEVELVAVKQIGNFNFNDMCMRMKHHAYGYDFLKVEPALNNYTYVGPESPACPPPVNCPPCPSSDYNCSTPTPVVLDRPTPTPTPVYKVDPPAASPDSKPFFDKLSSYEKIMVAPNFFMAISIILQGYRMVADRGLRWRAREPAGAKVVQQMEGGPPRGANGLGRWFGWLAWLLNLFRSGWWLTLVGRQAGGNGN